MYVDSVHLSCPLTAYIFTPVGSTTCNSTPQPAAVKTALGAHKRWHYHITNTQYYHTMYPWYTKLIDQARHPAVALAQVYVSTRI